IGQLECSGANGGATCNTGVTYFHSDRLGSVDTITGNTQPVHVTRDPYGRVLASGGAAASSVHIGFLGEEQDDDLGLINLNHRLYDPRLGRFISPDPLVTSPLSSQGHNLYAYGLNSPTINTDPSGLSGSSEPDPPQDDSFEPRDPPEPPPGLVK